jgi:glutamine---fructose-6-phosphate transaminase (isomerizing)
MSLMRHETQESAAAVQRCLAQTDAFAKVATRLMRLDPPFVVVSARGSSGHVGTFLRYLIARELGLVGAAAMPSVASLYGRRLRMQGALFVGISQSGRSPDLLRQAELARESGALTLAIVNDPASPLTQACEMVLDIAAGPERSVAATKTVLASLAAAIALVATWSGRSTPWLDELPTRLTEAMRLDWSALVRLLADVDQLFTVGRGAALGIAAEAALKLAETCGIAGMAYSAAELAHGPMALAGPDVPILGFVQNDATLPPTREALAGLAARGVPVLVAGGVVPGAVVLPSLPPLAPDADLLCVLASFYLAAESASRVRGFDPDHPPSLRKVTRTI